MIAEHSTGEKRRRLLFWVFSRCRGVHRQRRCHSL